MTAAPALRLVSDNRPITVTLSPSELQIAATVAVLRQVENIGKGRRDAHGAAAELGWQLHIEGAAGEMAVAKWLGRYWNGALGDLNADDVGNVQVRTASRASSHLLLHPDDPDDRAFILVTGTAPSFTLRGWIWGRDGKRPEFWRDPVGGRACYFVPQSALRPMRRRGEGQR